MALRAKIILARPLLYKGSHRQKLWTLLQALHLPLGISVFVIDSLIGPIVFRESDKSWGKLKIHRFLQKFLWKNPSKSKHVAVFLILRHFRLLDARWQRYTLDIAEFFWVLTFFRYFFHNVLKTSGSSRLGTEWIWSNESHCFRSIKIPFEGC